MSQSTKYGLRLLVPAGAAYAQEVVEDVLGLRPDHEGAYAYARRALACLQGDEEPWDVVANVVERELARRAPDNEAFVELYAAAGFYQQPGRHALSDRAASAIEGLVR